MKEMRRKKQALSASQIETVIKRNNYGVLSLSDEDGQPYGVPINYVYADGCFYFHCAQQGHKIDIIDVNRKASFTIVDSDRVIPETFSTDYISIIAFGNVSRITDEEEKMRTLRLFTDALGIDDHAMKEKEIMSGLSHVEMLRFKTEHMTGKGAMAVMKKTEEFGL